MKKNIGWCRALSMLDSIACVIFFALLWALIVAAMGVIGLGANEAVKILGAL